MSGQNNDVGSFVHWMALVFFPHLTISHGIFDGRELIKKEVWSPVACCSEVPIIFKSVVGSGTDTQETVL
jgi:hypothetical protein